MILPSREENLSSKTISGNQQQANSQRVRLTQFRQERFQIQARRIVSIASRFLSSDVNMSKKKQTLLKEMNANK